MSLRPSYKFSILILTIGIPAAGKSTWVKEYLKKNPYTYVISTDDIRKELTGTEQCVDPSFSDHVHDVARERVAKILQDPVAYERGIGFGQEILVDSTNVDLEEWVKYKKLKPSVILAKVFETTPEEAEKRQRDRERKVPFEVLQEKWQTLQKNKTYIPYIFNLLL